MSRHEIPYKIYLQESEMPTRWYNLRADMKNKPAPLLNPATLQPCRPEELEAVFCADLVRQELDDTTPFFDIPQEVREYYRTYRPSPLVRAYNLEKKLGTPAKIYYKFEGNNTSGSHKLNSAIAQAYYAKKQGLTGVTTETAVTHPGYRYVLGSVLNQVLLHQSVIGLEAKAALDKYGVKPDVIIGCAGGGSNLGGLIAPFMGEKLRGEADYRFIAVEPASCPSMTRGKFAYDFCDTGRMCPLAKMYTLGSGFIPSPNHAGGLRYHGMSGILSQLYHDGYMEARSVEQTAVFEAAEYFARAEGILPAPESSHAIRAAIDEAVRCRETGEEKTILFGLTGTGYFDMVAYEKFHNGEMSDYIPTDADLQTGFDGLPTQPQIKATPHNSRLTPYAPLRQAMRAICVAKMLDNTQSIICAFCLAAVTPRLPYRHIELCGIA